MNSVTGSIEGSSNTTHSSQVASNIKPFGMHVIHKTCILETADGRAITYDRLSSIKFYTLGNITYRSERLKSVKNFFIPFNSNIIFSLFTFFLCFLHFRISLSSSHSRAVFHLGHLQSPAHGIYIRILSNFFDVFVGENGARNNRTIFSINEFL